MKDLQPMCKEIEAIIKKHVGLKETPAIVIAFTCEPDWNEAHWIMNIQRPQAVMILRATADKITVASN
ncbi:hypothetical protein [Arsenicibacter rosenii]|uniref:Uncharacterized protein n=1 Tax=Arsenicibacter rosenii TaxID=1750698 RepID=A0A1S2VLZ4_9BACT|nr:hypothetical protein [Arsenicibacter rosenii]OIN59769.1 hypothetical protein BLX24_07895 [Arsenicibacter rosenii]